MKFRFEILMLLLVCACPLSAQDSVYSGNEEGTYSDGNKPVAASIVKYDRIPFWYSDYLATEHYYENIGGRSLPMPFWSGDFERTSSHQFISAGFRLRGYEWGRTTGYINGIYFNDALNGDTPMSLLLGLDEAIRFCWSSTGGSVPGKGMGHAGEVAGMGGVGGLGGIGGASGIDMRASLWNKGFGVSLMNGNLANRFRVSVSYGSGEVGNGWFYALTLTARQGGNDWIRGLNSNSWAYSAAVEKKIGYDHWLGLSVFGSVNEDPLRGASTQEVYDILDNNYYNPLWGYDGTFEDKNIESSTVRRSHEPVAMLTYNYKPDEDLKISASASYRIGRNGVSGLGWTESFANPYPDIYDNVPSYYRQFGYDSYHYKYYSWLRDWNTRQVDWDRLRSQNEQVQMRNDKDYYGGVDPTGSFESQYILGEHRRDQKDFNAQVQVVANLGDGQLAAGAAMRINRTDYYRSVRDMLGGDLWFDVEKFPFGSGYNDSQRQSNLDTPNRLVGKDDKYGYHYRGHLNSDRIWAAYNLKAGRFTLNAGAELGYTSYYREGIFRKGLFPNDSEGKAAKQKFRTYTVKAGGGYDLNENQSLALNLVRMQNAPLFEDAYISPRSHNRVVDGLTTEKVTSAELSWAGRYQEGIKWKLTAFLTDIRDGAEHYNYFDDVLNSYSDLSLTGVNRQHSGAELYVEVPVAGRFSARGVLNYGYYKYTSNPRLTHSTDNNTGLLADREIVYWDGMKVEATPQTAASLGIFYHNTSKGFYAELSGCYYDAMYISMNPLLRTDRPQTNLTPEQSEVMSAQERFDSAFTLNLAVAKTWYVDRLGTLRLNAEVNNLLNDTQIKSGGYEQMMVLRENSAQERYRRLDSKYFYMPGMSYRIGLSLSF